MRLGLLRAMPRAWDVAYNAAMLERYARSAAARGAELLVTCECFLDGYCADSLAVKARFTGGDRARFEAVAQGEDSPLLTRICALCRELRLGLVLGYSSISRDGVRNTALLLGPDGAELGRYHKTHLYEHDLNYIPGDALPVFDTPWGCEGMLICADRRWSEAARALRLQGAQILLIPTYGMRHEANTCWMRTRAYENECFVAFCHPELALLCNPDGEVEEQLQSNVPGILLHDVDLSRCRDTMLRLRRTDLYGAPAREPDR